MTRTRTSRTTLLDPGRAATMRDIVVPARNDITCRDTTVYSEWLDEPTPLPVRGRTPTMRMEPMGGGL